MPFPKSTALVLATTIGAATATAQTNLFLDLDLHTLETARSAVQSALETRPAGNSVHWSVRGVAEGTVTPRRTWRSRSGHWCREYNEAVTLTDGRQYAALGIRCRNSQGRWLVPEG